MEKTVIKSVSNYEIFKQNALVRFHTFDQELLIKRLNLKYDETYIYPEFCKTSYRFHRALPILERQSECQWIEADTNEVLSLCDLLCHTEKPISLSQDFMSLQSLNRVKSGDAKTVLGSGMFHKTELLFDGKGEELAKACETLGGFPAGKGDIAYEIPLYGPIHLRISFYHSDEEFDASLTMYFPSNICDYLFYETLYYIVGLIIEKITKLMASFIEKDY